MVNDVTDNFHVAEEKIEDIEVLKELFDIDKWMMISDLTKSEIKLFMRIRMIAKIKKLPVWEEALKEMALLMISNKRKSRKELVSAIMGVRMKRGMFGRMRPDNGMYNDRGF